MWKYIKPTTKPFVQLDCPASTVTLANSSDKLAGFSLLEMIWSILQAYSHPMLVSSNMSMCFHVHVYQSIPISIYCISVYLSTTQIAWYLKIYYPIWFTTSGTSEKKRCILIPAAMFSPHVETKRPSTSNLYINIFLFWFVLPHCWWHQDRCFDTSPTLSHWNLSTLYISICIHICV